MTMVANRIRLKSDRGAALIEYALLTALIVLGTIAAIQVLSDNSEDYLRDTGETIGTPRERNSDVDPDVPNPPAWLNN